MKLLSIDVLLCALVLLLCTCTAQSIPSLAGPSGTGVLPTAGPLTLNTTRVAFSTSLDAVVGSGYGRTLLRHSLDSKYAGIGYGCDLSTVELPDDYSNNDDSLFDDDDQTEEDEEWSSTLVSNVISSAFLYVYLNSFTYAENRQVNARLRFYPLANGDGAAIGLRLGEHIDLDANRPDCTSQQVYLVATKSLSTCMPLTRASAGVNWTKRTIYDASDSCIRPYISGEMYFSKNISLAADYQFPSKNLDDSGLYSVVLRSQASRYFNFDLGVTNLADDGVSGTAWHNIFAGMSMTLH